MLLTTALTKYEVQLQANGRSPHTIAQYHRHIRGFDRWIRDEGRDRRMDRIGHEALAEFLSSSIARLRSDGRPKRASSMNVLRSSLRAFFAYAHEAGYSPRNPARLIRRARCGPPPPRSLSDDEQKRFFDALDRGSSDAAARDRLLFRLMLATGMRLGEALAIEVGDVDLDRDEIALRWTKGARPRTVPIPQCVRDDLHRWMGMPRSGSLFTGPSGNALSTRHVRRRFDQCIARAGIARRTSPHSLRHTFARRMYETTGDLLRVKRYLGHRSLHATMVYTDSMS